MSETVELWLKGLREASQKSIGYPLSKFLDHAWLPDLLRFPLNNIGDPYVDGTYSLNTKHFERDVIDFFMHYFRAPEDAWGYITSGGSEANLFGLYVARRYLPEASVFASSAAHYSIAKACDILCLPQVIIQADDRGCMDYEDLHQQLKMYNHQDIIVVSNAGTTVHEARDDVRRIASVLSEHGIRRKHIHVDAALAGAYLPFVRDCEGFDFVDGADSISVSGHKFFGSPMPCGVVLTRADRKDLIGKSIAYLGSVDSTIGGSRNAITPVLLWSIIERLGWAGLFARYRECDNLAGNLVTALNEVGIAAWRHPGALTVVIPRASERMITRWDLASDAQWSHIVVVPGITWEILADFVDDLAKGL